MLSNLPETRGSRHVEMSTVSNSSTIHRFYADIDTFGQRIYILMSMNENPIVPQHCSRKIGSHLFVKMSNDGLKNNCNTT